MKPKFIITGTIEMRDLINKTKLEEPDKNPEQQETPDTAVLVQERTEVKAPWRVLLYNDEVHTFREVIIQLTKAINCSSDQAEEIALKVHQDGKALVYEGNFEPCFEVNSILKEIQLITEIKG